MKKVMLIILMVLSCGAFAQSFEYDGITLEGKIVSYYRLLSVHDANVFLLPTSSSLEFNQTNRDQMAINNAAQKAWRPLSHQVILRNNSSIDFVFADDTAHIAYDLYYGEFSLNDENLFEKLRPQYLKHFDAIFRHTDNQETSNNVLWISEMTCSHEKYATDDYGTIIPDAMKCEMYFIYDQR